MSKSMSLDAAPASLRKPVSSSRFAHGLISRGQAGSALNAGAEARAAALAKSRFTRLPHEPEDARITGVTRSLNRRLLALNLSGPRFSDQVIEQAKIA